MSAVEFMDVVKIYGKGDGKQVAVNRVSFTIESGEFVVILGQSGAGKSTVLNMLGGMDIPTEGKVLVDGKEISSYNDRQLSEYRADTIGFIFQFYNLLPGLTAYEEVTAMLKRKMLRDIKANFAQFFSIMLLSLIAMWCYMGFQANVIGGNKARTDFESSSNFADGWIYGADFDKEQARKIANISGIKDVQQRTEVLGKADEKYNTAEMYCYFQNDTDVTIPRTVDGADFDADDENGLWLFSKFAESWDME
ncbi:MAG: ATP-binding cassette domain-containing protein [Oscillospiraceae bacterium]|nr:ATP-binding cassette domain-containing protein [Oscillospiraceae bacterium]